MARAVTTEPSKVYVGMLIITAVAMLVGIFVLVMEGGEYDWAQKAPSAAAPALPQPPKDNTTTAEVKPKPVESAKAFEDAPSRPAVVPAPLPAFTPVAVDPPKPVEAKPEETKPLQTPPAPATGPIPSPLVIPGR